MAKAKKGQMGQKEKGGRGTPAAKGATTRGRTQGMSMPSDDFEEGGDMETGTPDPDYNLVSILYHALQGAETYYEYIEDAEEVGDRELVAFFKEVQEKERDCAERAKQILATRLTGKTGRATRGRAFEEEAEAM